MTPEEIAVVTCQTAGCESNGVGIQVSITEPPAETRVVCGPCGQPITNKVIGAPTQNTEIPEWLT